MIVTNPALPEVYFALVEPSLLSQILRHLF